MPVVRVTWFAGKDSPAKKEVAKDITESIVKHTGTDANVHLRDLRRRCAL